MVRKLNSRSGAGLSSRVQRRNEARKIEILRAAARVFRRLGLANAGMRDIAEEADLSPGNLYHYFRGKDEILLFCQERTLERLLEMIETARRSQAGAAEQLHEVLCGHVRCVLDELEGAAAHLEVEALPEALRAPVIEKRDAYERSIRTLVAQGVERGEFTPCNVVLVTRGMLGAVNWTARWYRSAEHHSVDEIANALADYLVRGLTMAPYSTQPAAVPTVASRGRS